MIAPSSNRLPIVLLVSDEYPPFTSWGGNAYQMSHLARLLRSAGYRVEIIALSDGTDEFCHLDDHGNLVHRVVAKRSFSMKALKKVSKSAARSLWETDLPFAIRVAEKVFELTTVWRREILWIEATNWKAQSAVLQLFPELNRRHALRIVTPMAEVAVQNKMPASPALRAALAQETAQQLLLKHRFYSNEEYKPYFESRVRTSWNAGARRAEERIFLLPFDFSRVPLPKRRVRRADEPIRILIIGRIEPRKGFESICSALAALSERERQTVQIVSIGRDVDMGPLNSFVAMLRAKFGKIVDRFEFRGWVSDEDVAGVMETCDVGIVASLSESFGYNLVELVASNLPVITSDVGVASELERRGIRYLVKYKEVPELSAAFSRLGELLAAFGAREADNRRALEEIYVTNDRDYLDYVRSRFGAATNPPFAASNPPTSAEVVVCSYNRFEELTISIGSILQEFEAPGNEDVDCGMTVVYQNDGLPERIYAWRPDLRENPRVRFVESNPPSLTRARNVGAASTERDVVIFVDDDVILDPGFVRAHLRAFAADPGAVGAVGRILSAEDRAPGVEAPVHRSVGQIRVSGLIHTHFNTLGSQATIVPTTPMGANMAYRRERMNAVLGPKWFDETFTGSAFREETTTALRLFRAGEHLVFAPDASLFHFEAVQGGCSNRSSRTTQQRIAHAELDFLYLNHLYEDSSVLRTVIPFWHARRDLRWSSTRADTLQRTYVAARGIFGARRLFRGSSR